MQPLLGQQGQQRLLSLLFGSEERSFSAIQREFADAFQPRDQFSACCAAVLLLEVRCNGAVAAAPLLWHRAARRRCGDSGGMPQRSHRWLARCLAPGACLQDATILRVPQRIAAWFLLSTSTQGLDGTSPFLSFLVKVRHQPAPAASAAGDERANGWATATQQWPAPLPHLPRFTRRLSVSMCTATHRPPPPPRCRPSSATSCCSCCSRGRCRQR